MKKYTINEHWDPLGIITSKSDPKEEFERWKKFADENPQDWNGDEFTLEYFEGYIEGLIEAAV